MSLCNFCSRAKVARASRRTQMRGGDVYGMWHDSVFYMWTVVGFLVRCAGTLDHWYTSIEFNWIFLSLSFLFFIFHFCVISIEIIHSRTETLHNFITSFFSLLLPRCTFTLLHFTLLYSHQLYSIDLFLSGDVQSRELFLFEWKRKSEKKLWEFSLWISPLWW